ncbi:Fic family protein [Acidipropionibacterium virtanenii]|uniref:Adenosine monophosphate-protein transferase SoFic n=1 Tax=Acidipropionibacterium virtanenii TaxID=2057246 RepID=A0A344UR41_9ACTN|nr:Fic family protein [Acidipropionibacterium virtanenii]AXE37739.1 Adenosine monophosphate-protein transferase SoFic [Acidipropionibacterium virtanenii]
MAHWEGAYWHSDVASGVPRRDRRSGPYQYYVPDRLTGSPLTTGPDLDELLSRAERAVVSLNSGPGANDLAHLSRFLIRSEAIASSRIEGIAPSARQVALAELAQEEDLEGFSAQAELVARNMTLVRDATTRLAAADRISVEDVVAVHDALLADDRHHLGLRTLQNWIGGSYQHPIDADFVPPAPDLVGDLMTDLVQYLNGAAHAPVVQAGLVHAQFETIHPFTDGNGRVGRALIHTTLTRRGLTSASVLPVSLVLATFSDEYVRGLSGYRYVGDAGSTAGITGRQIWLVEFAGAVLKATEQAETLREDVTAVREDWEHRLSTFRSSQGQRRLRADSATARVLEDLPGTPVLTAATVERIHGVSAMAAGRALGELEEAGILKSGSAGRRRRAYWAPDVLDLITATERRLASTRFDTRASSPNRQVPARPR